MGGVPLALGLSGRSGGFTRRVSSQDARWRRHGAHASLPQPRAQRRAWQPVRPAAASSTASTSFSEESSPQPVVQPSLARRLLHSPHDADIFALAVPALFSLLLDPLMGMTDTALVGRLGSTQLAAVGLSTVILTFASLIFNWLLFITTPNVAGAVARGDAAKASEVSARGLWVAVVAGTLLGGALLAGAPWLAGRMLGGGPDVAVHAVAYLRSRALGMPALLGMYVIIGSFRGHKDTRSPLYASVLSNIVNFSLDIALMFGLGWGVAGAALATAASQYVSFGLLYARMLRTGMLRPEHMARPPAWSAVKPFLTSGLALSTRSIVLMGTYTFATSLVAQLGAASLAASEIVRQVFVLSLQAFGALDVSSQALVGSYLGQGDARMARGVLLRVLQLGSLAACLIGAAIWAARDSLPMLFTNDPAVRAIAASTLPLLSCMMPLDAIGAVMDGGLLGAQETAWVTRVAFVHASLVFAGLAVQRWLGLRSLFWLWGAMKLMAVGRVLTGAVRYASPDCKLSAAAANAS